MSTEKESTLEIKDFRGISRYLASPNTPPNKLFTIQNMYSPNRGELAYVNGVVSTSLVADGFSTLVGDFNFNGQRLMMNADSGSGLPLPGVSGESFTFAATGGTTTGFIRITYAGLGYETSLNSVSAHTLISMGTGGTGASVIIGSPSLIPNQVCQVNFYISPTDVVENYTLLGTLTRSNKASFPSSQQFFQTGWAHYDNQTDPLGLQEAINPYDPVQNIVLQGHNVGGGTLVPGQTYFMAFVPMVIGNFGGVNNTNYGAALPIASMYIDDNRTFPPTAFPASPIAITLPIGSNAISFAVINTGTYDGTTAYLYSYVFLGTTPEDMMMVSCTYTGQTNTFSGPCPIPISGFTPARTNGVIAALSPCSNLGIAMMPYAEATQTATTPAYTWASQRIGFFWLGGLTYSNTGNYVCGLLFPKNQLNYGSGTGIDQVLPVRGAGMITGFAPGLASQYAPTGLAPFTIVSAPNGNVLPGSPPNSITSGSNAVAMTSVTNVLVGQLVTGTGIASSSHVSSIDVTNNIIYLNHNATTNGNGVTLTFQSAGSDGQSAGQMLSDGTIWNYNATSQTAGPAVPFLANYFSLNPYTPSQFYITTNGNGVNKVRGAVLGQYMFFVNGFQQPFYTNGQILKPVMTDAMSAYAPICNAIKTFQNQLVMGGGQTNNYANYGQIYWSALFSDGTPNPFAFSSTELWGAVQNSATLLGNGPGNILGFGIFSYNQSVNSITTQLVIGTDTSIWMTPTLGAVAQNPQEVGRGMGFASPDCFVNTNIGAFYVGRDNLYQLNQFGLPVAKGQDVLQLIRGMLKSGTNFPPVAYYHQQQIKVAYSTGGTSYDTEIWCDVQLERVEQSNADVPRNVWMGPHTINSVLGYCVFPSGVFTDISSTLEDYRSGFTTGSSAVLDYPGKTSNNGAAVARLLVFNDLYLNTDDFMKILKRLYVGGKFTSNPTMVVTFNMTDQDGAGEGPSGTPTSYTDSIVINPQAKSFAYMLNEKIFATRYRGRIVNAFTLSWSDGAAEQTMNIYEISLLYESQRRRKL